MKLVFRGVIEPQGVHKGDEVLCRFRSGFRTCAASAGCAADSAVVDGLFEGGGDADFEAFGGGGVADLVGEGGVSIEV